MRFLVPNNKNFLEIQFMHIHLSYPIMFSCFPYMDKGERYTSRKQISPVVLHDYMKNLIFSQKMHHYHRYSSPTMNLVYLRQVVVPLAQKSESNHQWV